MNMYFYGNSLLHKMPVGFKFAAIFVIALILFYFPYLSLNSVAFLLVLVLFAVAYSSLKLGVRAVFQQLKLIFWLLLALWLVQALSTHYFLANLIILRLMTLYLLASLLTLTTPFSATMDFFEKIFAFLRFFKVNPAKISLILALTLRFIPLFQQITKDVREAQKARGLENNIFALVMPVFIRCLQLQEDYANAIEARCYDR